MYPVPVGVHVFKQMAPRHNLMTASILSFGPVGIIMAEHKAVVPEKFNDGEIANARGDAACTVIVTDVTRSIAISKAIRRFFKNNTSFPITYTIHRMKSETQIEENCCEKRCLVKCEIL